MNLLELTQENIQEIIRNKTNTIIKEKTEKIFVVKERDTLFWCYHIIANGHDAYMELKQQTRPATQDLTLRIELVKLLREKDSRNLIKQYKKELLYKTLGELESQVAVDSFISENAVMALCLVQGINCQIVDEKGQIIRQLSESNNPVKKIQRTTVNGPRNRLVNKYSVFI